MLTEAFILLSTEFKLSTVWVILVKYLVCELFCRM